MELGGVSYLLSCQDCGPQKVQKHLLKPQVSEGKLIIPVEDKREIIIEFFKNRSPKIDGDTDNDRVTMTCNGKLIFSNNQAEQKKMSESLDEDDEQNFQLDGATLFIGSREQSDTVKSKYRIQFNRALQLVPRGKTGQPVKGIKPFVTQSSFCKKSELVHAGLHPNSQGGRDFVVWLSLKQNEIKQIDEYLNLDETGKKRQSWANDHIIRIIRMVIAIYMMALGGIL